MEAGMMIGDLRAVEDDRPRPGKAVAAAAEMSLPRTLMPTLMSTSKR